MRSLAVRRKAHAADAGAVRARGYNPLRLTTHALRPFGGDALRYALSLPAEALA